MAMDLVGRTDSGTPRRDLFHTIHTRQVETAV